MDMMLYDVAGGCGLHEPEETRLECIKVQVVIGINGRMQPGKEYRAAVVH